MYCWSDADNSPIKTEAVTAASEYAEVPDLKVCRTWDDLNLWGCFTLVPHQANETWEYLTRPLTSAEHLWVPLSFRGITEQS